MWTSLNMVLFLCVQVLGTSAHTQHLRLSRFNIRNKEGWIVRNDIADSIHDRLAEIGADNVPENIIQSAILFDNFLLSNFSTDFLEELFRTNTVAPAPTELLRYFVEFVDDGNMVWNAANNVYMFLKKSEEESWEEPANEHEVDGLWRMRSSLMLPVNYEEEPEIIDDQAMYGLQKHLEYETENADEVPNKNYFIKKLLRGIDLGEATVLVIAPSGSLPASRKSKLNQWDDDNSRRVKEQLDQQTDGNLEHILNDAIIDVMAKKITSDDDYVDDDNDYDGNKELEDSFETNSETKLLENDFNDDNENKESEYPLWSDNASVKKKPETPVNGAKVTEDPIDEIIIIDEDADAVKNLSSVIGVRNFNPIKDDSSITPSTNANGLVKTESPKAAEMHSGDLAYRSLDVPKVKPDPVQHEATVSVPDMEEELPSLLSSVLLPILKAYGPGRKVVDEMSSAIFNVVDKIVDTVVTEYGKEWPENELVEIKKSVMVLENNPADVVKEQTAEDAGISKSVVVKNGPSNVVKELTRDEQVGNRTELGKEPDNIVKERIADDIKSKNLEVGEINPDDGGKQRPVEEQEETEVTTVAETQPSHADKELILNEQVGTRRSMEAKKESGDVGTEPSVNKPSGMSNLAVAEIDSEDGGKQRTVEEQIETKVSATETQPSHTGKEGILHTQVGTRRSMYAKKESGDVGTEPTVNQRNGISNLIVAEIDSDFDKNKQLETRNLMLASDESGDGELVESEMVVTTRSDPYSPGALFVPGPYRRSKKHPHHRKGSAHHSRKHHARRRKGHTPKLRKHKHKRVQRHHKTIALV